MNSNSLFFLFDVLICVAALIVGRCKPEVSKEDVVFAYPGFLGFILLFCGLFSAAILVLPCLHNNFSPPILGVLPFSLFSLMGAGGALYFFRYRLILARDRLIIRILLKEQIEFCNITRVQYVKNRQRQCIFIWLVTGRRFAIDGLVRDLPALAKAIESRMPEGPIE